MLRRIASRVGLRNASRATAVFAMFGMLMSIGAVVYADSPSPVGPTKGDAVISADGKTATVTVSGVLAWKGKKDCKSPAGYAVAWNDPSQAGNPVGPGKKSGLTAYVGVLNGTGGLNPTDNAIHAAGCSNGSAYTWGPISHVYKTSKDAVTVCAVGYHMKKSPDAGGANREKDNSIEENDNAPDPGACVTFTAPPPPTPTPTPTPTPKPPVTLTTGLTLDKKVNGGDHASADDALNVHSGDPLVYTIVITNTGDAPLTIANLKDSLHNLQTSECNGDGDGTVLNHGDTITCAYSAVASTAAHNVASVTGIPATGNALNRTDGTFVGIVLANLPHTKPATPATAIVTQPHTTG